MKLNETLDLDLMLERYGFYPPRYDKKEKSPVGYLKDWMEMLEISPDDVKEAYEQAKELPSYKKLAEKFKVVSTKGDKNGTFYFETNVKTYVGERNAKLAGQKVRYVVYANGVIRREGDRMPSFSQHVMTRLKAPKPRVVPGNPIKTLLKIYDGAFKELLSKKVKTDQPVK